MNTPTFNLDKIKYNYSIASRKWEFISDSSKYSVLINCKGAANAHAVGKQVNAAVKRCGALDGLAKSAIVKIVGKVY